MTTNAQPTRPQYGAAAGLIFLLLSAATPLTTHAHPAGVVATVLDHDARSVEVRVLDSPDHPPAEAHKVRWSGNGIESPAVLIGSAATLTIPHAYGSEIAFGVDLCQRGSFQMECSPCSSAECQAEALFLGEADKRATALSRNITRTGDQPFNYGLTPAGAQSLLRIMYIVIGVLAAVALVLMVAARVRRR